MGSHVRGEFVALSRGEEAVRVDNGPFSIAPLGGLGVIINIIVQAVAFTDNQFEPTERGGNGAGAAACINACKTS